MRAIPGYGGCPRCSTNICSGPWPPSWRRLAGGALCGRLGSVKRTLIGVVALAVAIFVAVLVLSRLNGFADLAAMLSIAAFMFGLVIAAAASLLTRRILLRRAER